MTLRKWLLTITGALTAAFGLIALVAPGNLAAMLQFELLAPSAFIEIRASYGGLFVGLGLFYLYAANRGNFHLPALWSIAGLIGGLMCGRLAGFIIDGSPDATQYTLLAFEAVVLSGMLWVIYGSYTFDGHRNSDGDRAFNT